MQRHGLSSIKFNNAKSSSLSVSSSIELPELLVKSHLSKGTRSGSQSVPSLGNVPF
jgi:hypothetical protein